MDKDIEKKLGAIWTTIKSLESRMTKIETGMTGVDHVKTAPRGSAKKLSIKEFLLERPPSTDIQRTRCIGYFLENHAGMASFNKPDVEKAYRDAKEPVPSNIGVNIKHCIKQGHMMETEEKKDNRTAYVVTSSGERFVQGGYKKADGK